MHYDGAILMGGAFGIDGISMAQKSGTENAAYPMDLKTAKCQ